MREVKLAEVLDSEFRSSIIKVNHRNALYELLYSLLLLFVATTMQKFQCGDNRYSVRFSQIS